MPNFNRTFLMGHLTRDPELRYLQNNTPVCSIGLAVNRKWKSQSGEQREEVLFIDADAWGRTAEVINEHFQKGRAIFAEGHLKFEQWDDKDGNKRSKIKLVIESFQFVGGDGQQQQGNQGGQSQATRRGNSRSSGRSQQPQGDDGYGEYDSGPPADEDIPF